MTDFVGDGERYDLGNGWWYHYVLDIDTGYWGKGDSPSDWVNQRFNYNYSIGLWNHKAIAEIFITWVRRDGGTHGSSVTGTNTG